MIVLLLLLIFLLWCYRNSNMLVKYLILLHIISVGIGPFIGYHMDVDSFADLCWIIYIFAQILLITSAFSKIDKNITIFGDARVIVKKYKYILIFFLVMFISTLPILFVLSRLNIDIQDFKYNNGFQHFIDSGILPIPKKVFVIITLFVDVYLYFLPLHFFFLFKKNYKYSFLWLLASLTYVLEGLTFFSRAQQVQFMLVYLATFFMFYKVMPSNVKKYIRYLPFILIMVFFIRMLSISENRFSGGEIDFESNTEVNYGKYEYVKDDVTLSYLDYAAQGYYNGYYLSKRYNGDTWHGQTTFQTLLTMLNQYLGIPFSTQKYQMEREKLWPRPYNVMFTGYSTYVLYDFGLILSFIISFFFYYVVRKIGMVSSKQGFLTLEQAILLTALLLIPTGSIFFSNLSSYTIGFIILEIMWRINFKRSFFRNILKVKTT